jgi:ABC-2 type transport system permease protein
MRVIFNNILAIYRKELQGYFGSPFAYVIAAVFWLLAGVFFVLILAAFLQQIGEFDLRQAQTGVPPQPVDMPYEIMRNFLGTLQSLAQVFLPMLSMGLYAEERRRGTLELLATSPITNWCVALGKWLAVVTFVATLILPLMVYESIAYSTANAPIPIGIMLVGHGGLLLWAAAILALGLFISSLTDSSILAAIMTFALVLLLWILDIVAQNVGGPAGEVLGHLSIARNFTNLVQGVLDGKAIILFASYIVLGLFLTAQSIDALRFQRS